MAGAPYREKEVEVNFLLNTLSSSGMDNLAPSDAVREVLEDYFCDPELSDTTITSDEEEEEDIGVTVGASDTPTSASTHSSAVTRPTFSGSVGLPVPGTSHDDYDSDDEPFSPLQDLARMVNSDVRFTPDEETAAATISADGKLCSCKLNEGKPCYTRFKRDDLEFIRLQALEMTREELDISILSKLSCTINLTPQTKRSKHKEQTERKFHRTDYMFLNFRVCREVFKYMHAISQDKLNSLVAHYKAAGIEARVHKLKKQAPKHALLFSERQAIVTFIVNYAEIHAITLPGRTPHQWRADVRLLPTNCTKKTVYDAYVSSCTTSGVRVVAYRTFIRLWQELLPFITTMRPATDLCWFCQKTAALVARSQGKETLKSKAYAEMGQHLETVTKERSVYTTVCQEAKRSLPPDAKLGPHPACGWDGSTHYSFDFAQQVHYPTNPLQPGPIFFKTPRKCGLFGVCCEALSSQVNFLLEEAVDTGKGANCVVSLLHFFFENYGLGEQEVHLHADNCSGQNKNSCMMMYLMWRVLTGRHKAITLSFLITGHTKFSCDWCFGLVKRLFRRTKVDCLDDIASVVNQSSVGNIAQLCGNEKGEVYVHRYDWTTYLQKYFRKVKQIKKYHHFSFSEGSGVLKLREYSDSSSEEQKLLISVPPRDEMPPVIQSSGLDAKRQWYLYDEIRQFVEERLQDLVAPLPNFPKPGRALAVELEETTEPVEEIEAAQAIPPAKKSRRGGKQGKKGGK